MIEIIALGFLEYDALVTECVLYKDPETYSYGIAVRAIGFSGGMRLLNQDSSCNYLICIFAQDLLWTSARIPRGKK